MITHITHNWISRHRTTLLTYVIIMISVSIFANDVFAQPTIKDFQRTWNWFSNPEIPLRVRVNETIPLVVICMDFEDDPAVYTREQIEDMVFGPAPSVVDYYRWASKGKFEFARLGRGVYGWYRAPKSQAEYTSTNVRRSDTILQALNDFLDIDFSKIDRNGDHVISPDELSIFAVWGGRRFSDAAARNTFPAQLPLGNGYTVNLLIGATYEGRLRSNGTHTGLMRLSPATVIHELGHTSLGLTDLYPDSNPTTEAPGPFSLMDSDLSLDGLKGVPSLDPWALLQLGWLDATIVTGGPDRNTIEVVLNGVETSNEALVIPIYDRGTREYFIVENRFPENTYNGGFASNSRGIDNGLAIWHFDEDQMRNGAFEMRQALRLVRAQGPVPAMNWNVNQQQALFDAAEASTGYAWWDGSNPRSSKTRAGEQTGISIWPIPVPAPTVSFRVGNPYDELSRILPLLEEQLLGLRRELENIPRRLQEVRDAWNAGEISREAFLFEIQTINSRKRELEQNIIPGKLNEISTARSVIMGSTSPVIGSHFEILR